MSVPTTMRYIAIGEPGGPDVLRLAEGPVPAIGDDEVLIEVAAAGVNRPDLLQRMGQYPPPRGASPIPGLEVAGVVAAIGARVGSVTIGDEVCALVTGGGYARYCAAPAPQCLPKPKALSMAEAAALPETFFTVWLNVFMRGKLSAGETILIHGGSSGIGTTAIQLAHAFGARVLTTAGSAAKCDACLNIGADVAIDYRKQDFVAEVKAATLGEGVDVILDIVGGDYFGRNLDCLALDGRLMQIAFQGGSRVELDIAKLQHRGATVSGSALRPRGPAQKGEIAAGLRERVWPLLEAGQVRPVIYATFPLGEAAEAHRTLESSAHIGKVVLLLD